MGNTASNVTAGKPKVTGAIWAAPKGTSLPTDTTTALGGSFVCLGYVSDAGVSNGTGLEMTDVKAWGGDNVLSIQTSKDDTYKFTLIEVLNADVMKFVYGSDNVTGTLASGLTLKVNNKDIDERALVIDMILRDNTAKRITIPDAKVTAVDDIVYADNAAVGYGTTLKCLADSNGNTHYEYFKKPASV